MNNHLKKAANVSLLTISAFCATAFAQTPTFSIIMINGNKCFEVDNDNIGTKLRAADCSQDSNKQRFLFENNSIKTALDTNQCLSVISDNSSSSTAVFLWNCLAADQRKSFIQDYKISDNKIMLANNTNLCLTYNTQNYEIVADTCDTKKNQNIAFLAELKINENCLQLDSVDSGTVLRAMPCDASLKQKFFVYENQIKPFLDITKCLDSFNSDPQIKSVYLNQCLSDSKFQKFVINKASIVTFDSSRCMTVATGDKYKVSNAIELNPCAN